MLSNAPLIQSNDIAILFCSKIYKMEPHLELVELRVSVCNYSTLPKSLKLFWNSPVWWEMFKEMSICTCCGVVESHQFKRMAFRFIQNL